MSFFDNIKNLFKKSEKKTSEISGKPIFLSVGSIEEKYASGDYLGAARDLKSLLETYGRRKQKNHRYKGRVFIHFILSNKHKDLKNTGYIHWQNLNDYLRLNQAKIYPYHKNNLRNALDFFEQEIKGLYEIKIPYGSETQ